MTHDLGKLKRAYQVQRTNARARGIGFQMTFVEWLTIWAESGHLHERGLKGNGYVMSRFNDDGPYAADNVEIIRAADNSHQQQVTEKRRKTVAEKAASGFVREGNYCHLRDRTKHPKSRIVVDPDGVEYPSAAFAADMLGLTRAAIATRCRKGYGGWHYKDDPIQDTTGA